MNGVFDWLFTALIFTFAWSGVLYIVFTLFHRASGIGDFWSGYWLLALLLLVLPLAASPIAGSLPLPVAELRGTDGLFVPLAAMGSQHVTAPDANAAVPWTVPAAVIYLAGLAVQLARQQRARRRLKNILAATRRLEDAELHRELTRTIKRIEPHARVRLVVTQQALMPFTCGWRRPVIVLPVHLLNTLASAQLAMIVAHEAAHIRRRDAVTVELLAIARAMFWFSPFAQAFARRAAVAMELASDALALRCAPVLRRDYARTLLDVLRIDPQRVPATVSLIERSETMRIKTILVRPELSQPAAARKLVVFAAALLLAAPAAVTANHLLPSDTAPSRGGLLDGRITSPFGPRLLDDKPVHHNGVDVAAALGTPIHAPLDGQVITATDNFNKEPRWGKVVVIEFSNGIVARFAHLHDYPVKAGDRIKAGDVIARVGNTGKSTGPHVHIEARMNGKLVDPQTVFDLPHQGKDSL